MPGAGLGAGLVAASIGPLLLRWGWQRGRAAVIAGWGALLLAAILLALSHGAWGLAAGAVAAMAVASALLMQAALASPAPRGNGRKREAAASPRLPHDWRDTARRIAIFLIVVPLDLVAASFLACAIERMLFGAGWLEANTLTVALFAIPILWALAASWQMLCTRAVTMLAAPALFALIGGLLWLAA